MKTVALAWVAAISLLCSMTSRSRAGGAKKQSVSRIVVWQPKLGKEREFERGYQRHLEWHRQNHDTWRWYGWYVASGERDDYFLDGTFFHAWSDLDTPVAPAQDAADNELNVYPYGAVKSVATYETDPSLTHMQEAQLASPLITFYSIRVPADSPDQFETAMAGELAKAPAELRCVVFRPVSGVTEYLLAVASAKSSQLGVQAEFVRNLLQTVSRTMGTSSAAVTRVETARFRQDMSNLP
jgi:hypothetical protein